MILSFKCISKKTGDCLATLLQLTPTLISNEHHGRVCLRIEIHYQNPLLELDIQHLGCGHCSCRLRNSTLKVDHRNYGGHWYSSPLKPGEDLITTKDWSCGEVGNRDGEVRESRAPVDYR